MTKIRQSKRIKLFIYLALGAAALVILAAGMSNLDLQTGFIVFEQPEGLVLPEDTDEETPAEPRFVEPSNLTTILVLSGIALLILFAAYRWKQIRLALLVLLFFSGSVLGMIYLYTLYGEPPQQGEEEEVIPPNLEQTGIDEEALDNPPDIVGPISVAVAVVIAGIAVAAVIILMRRPWRKDSGTLDMIAAEAEAALADIRAGGNLRDAVMRCYFEMNQGLRKSMGLVRQEAMTPREFESALSEAGLPNKSVHRLTRLFESVRYGRHDATEREIREAVDSLEEIIEASQQSADRSNSSSLQPQLAER